MLPSNKPRSPLEALSLERFGGRTYSQAINKSLSTTPGKIVDNNPNRVFLMLFNYGTYDVRAYLSPDLSSGAYVILYAGGGGLVKDWNEDGESVGYEVWGVSAAGVGTIYGLEVIRL